MKQSPLLLVMILFLVVGCNSDKDDNPSPTNIQLNFSHFWEGDTVENSDFNSLKYSTENGDLISIERLRYLISDLRLTKADGETILLEGYNLVDVTNQTNLSYSPVDQITTGSYTNISFVFGFTNEKNTEGAYNSLNAVSWNVPVLLGGGYHYMQLDGKFMNSENEVQGYNFHAIRAVDNPGNNPSFPQDTFLQVNLGEITIGTDQDINIVMNIAEWFKTPNTWDLNQYNQMLMPNSSAQIMMYQNGQNVFSLQQIN